MPAMVDAKGVETRQQFLALGDEFLSVVAEGKANGRRRNSNGAELGVQLETLGRLLKLIEERMAAVESRLNEIGDVMVTTRNVAKEYYTTQEAAKILSKKPYTVREWCRLARVHAEKALSGRGIDDEWRISHDELLRIQNEGLLPVKKDCSIGAPVRIPR